MKKITLAFTLFTALLMSFSAFSQKEEEAELLFEEFSYAAVISTLEGEQNLSTNSLRMLSRSAVKVKDLKKAEQFYHRLNQQSDRKPEDLVGYANVLKSLGKYDEATVQMETFCALAPNDRRVVAFKENPDFLSQVNSDRGNFEIELVPVSGPQQDFGAVYLNDEIVFTSNREGAFSSQKKWNGNNLPYLNIFRSPATGDGQFGVVLPFRDKPNKKYNEGPVCFNAAGDYMLITRNNYDSRDESGVRRLVLLESSKTEKGWSKPKELPFCDKEFSVGHGSMTTDGNALYFASDMPGGIGGVDLYKVMRNADGSWGTPSNLGPTVNTEGNELFPFIHESGQLIFSSDGHPGLGGLDLFSIDVNLLGSSQVGNFGAPINSNRDDFSLIFDKEMETGFFSSDREGGAGDDDLYSFTASEVDVFVVKGKLVDPETGKPLSNTWVRLIDQDQQTLADTYTDSQGNFTFDVLNSNCNATLQVNNGVRWIDHAGNADLCNLSTNPLVLEDMKLVETDREAVGVLNDPQTGQTLVGKAIYLTNELTGEMEMFYTNGAGIVGMPLDEGVQYTVSTNQNGEEVLLGTLDTTDVGPGLLEIDEGFADSSEALASGAGSATNNVSTDNSAAGSSAADIFDFDLKKIYYDYNQSRIRSDAKRELDKLALAMKQNPNAEVELRSHADCRGTNDYNQALSERRAKAAIAYLTNKGIAKSRLSYKSFGESAIVNRCIEGVVCSEDEHEVNRRTEFKIIDQLGSNNE